MIFPVLTLDLAGRTGWADCQCDGTVQSGVRVFIGENVGRRFDNAFVILSKLFHTRKPAIVFVEMPFTKRPGDLAARTQYGYHAFVHLLAHERGVEVVEAPSTSVKLLWTGSGRANKAAMVAEAEARGFQPQDDNEADALAVLNYALTDSDITGPIVTPSWKLL